MLSLTAPRNSLNLAWGSGDGDGDGDGEGDADGSGVSYPDDLITTRNKSASTRTPRMRVDLFI